MIKIFVHPNDKLSPNSWDPTGSVDGFIYSDPDPLDPRDTRMTPVEMEKKVIKISIDPNDKRNPNSWDSTGSEFGLIHQNPLDPIGMEKKMIKI